MTASPLDSIGANDRIGLCLDVDGTIHRHGSIFVEALALLPYASDLSIEGDQHDALRDVLGTVAAYAGGDQSRRNWLTLLGVGDAFARLGLEQPVARVLARLIRHRARQASNSSSTGNAGDYRDMQRRILDQYGTFLEGRRHDRIERAFHAVIGTHLHGEPPFQRTLAELTAAIDLDVVLVTDVPTHIARPYAGLLGDEITAVGTDFAMADGRFTGEYTFIEKGEEVERLRADRDWDYTLAAGDSGNDLPMAGVADLFVAVEGRGNVAAELPAEYMTVDATPDLPGPLTPETDAIFVPRETTVASALRATFAALGVDTDDARGSREPGIDG